MLDKLKNKIINNDIEEAFDIILKNNDDYKHDIRFINLKSVLYIKIGEYDIAKNILEECISKENLDVYLNLDEETYKDIFYNLAYLYEIDKKFEDVYQIYMNLLTICKDHGEKNDIRVHLKRVKKISDYEIEDTYGKDNLLREDGYGKVKLKNLSYKNINLNHDDIHSMRSELNKLRDDEVPLVSIYILSYNNLEKYTKPCVESILKYTNDIDYELVLVDNGSNDGTYEYFKSIEYEKKRIIKITKNIGVAYQAMTALKEAQGKYVVLVCNDTIVTKNWLLNMIKCAESDNKIGMIVPASDNVSNLQSINLEYKDIEDMHYKAELNNVSDYRRWYERLKLVTIITFFTRECIDMIGQFDYGFLHDYSDDDITFKVRRAGYKAILCKDSFFSHRGLITDKGDKEFLNKSMLMGEKFFSNKYFGIIPRLDVVNYENDMLSLIDYENLQNSNYKILGIDTACGAPILELKNKLRENSIFNVKLSAFSTDAKYFVDLNTICENVVVDRLDYILEHYNKEFDFIILGKYINVYSNPKKLIDNLSKILKDDGILLLKLRNTRNIDDLLNNLNVYKNKFDDINYLNLTLEELKLFLDNSGFYCENILGLTNINDDDLSDISSTLFSDRDLLIGLNSNLDDIKVKDYIMSIKNNKV